MPIIKVKFTFLQIKIESMFLHPLKRIWRVIGLDILFFLNRLYLQVILKPNGTGVYRHTRASLGGQGEN